MRRITEVKTLPGYRLMLVFDDGRDGEVDIESRLFGPMFEPLRDERFFAQATVDEFGIVCWPNGADLDPDALYACLSARQCGRSNAGEAFQPKRHARGQQSRTPPL